jgi:hypothetical protein
MTFTKTISNLENNQPYQVRVRAQNINGYGPWTTLTGTPIYDAAYLMNYVRELTGVFSKDIITDDLLLFWINEAYFELSRLYEWPWNPITPLKIDESPEFDANFFAILAYRVAPRVLDVEADDSPRSAAYTKEYEKMLDNMYRSLLRGQETVVPSSMDDIVLQVRIILDEFSPRMENSLIEARITESHDELVAAENLVYPNLTFPRMGWADARVLAYGAAARLAPFFDKTQDFTNLLLNEFTAILEFLRMKYGYSESSRGNSVTSLVRQTRTFLGSFSNKASDDLLKTWIYEEYQNLCSEYDWTWLQKTENKTVASGASTIILDSPKFKIHEINRVELNGDGKITESEPLILVPSLIGVHLNTDKLYYSIEPTGIQVGPKQDESYVLRIRYEVVPHYGNLMPSTIEGSTGYSFDEFAIPERYLHILSYRVAMKASVAVGAPQNVFDMCRLSAESLYESMRKEYQLAHTQEPFQLGGSVMEERKYVPWFKA